MRITIILLFAVSTAMSGQAAVRRSSDLGWKAGQDVTEAFAQLFETGTLKAGDEFVLDHTYKISGKHELPDNFTLSAKKGAGFEVTDATPKAPGPFLTLGAKNTLRNVTITYLNTPPLGPTGEKHEVNFTRMTGILAEGKDDLLFENCRLIGSIGHHVKLADQCNRPRFIGCHIAGGHWSVLISAKDAVFKRCVIEKCQGDGIKGGADRILVDNCVFQDSLRDGIDTTGGINDAVIRNSIFRRLGTGGLDLKSWYDFRKTLDRPGNVGILIKNCRFVDIPNAIVLTTLDTGRRQGPGNELLTAENIAKYAPHDIDVNDCVFGYTDKPEYNRKHHDGGYRVDYPSESGEVMRAIYLKDAYSIRYRNASFFGDRIKPVYIRSIGGSRHLSKEAADALEPTISGTVAGPAQPAKPGDRSIPFKYGPQPPNSNPKKKPLQ